MNGIFNVHKPLGLTSHGVVAQVRRASGQRRVGHAGTLDPAAEGVLLVCVGSATRLAEQLMRSTKLYCAEVLLGVSTDTYDSEGKVTQVRPIRGITLGQVERALEGLMGRIMQTPPVYSALKRGGVPLYRLARQGTPVQVQPREVEVYGARVLAWRPPLLRVEFTCGPGTYVRSLAHDLGERLGCGACLTHLVRLASGRFWLEEAVPLWLLVDALANAYWQEFLYPLDDAVLDLDALLLGGEREAAFRHGRPWPARAEGMAGLARTYSLEGDMLGIAEQKDGLWCPRKVLV